MIVTNPIKHFQENPGRSVSNMRHRIQELWRRQTACVNPNPVLVFGNQKAGTSAITALLGEATDLSYTIDIFCLYQGLEERLFSGEGGFEEVLEKGRYYFSKDIVKDPSFTFFYSTLADRFPTAKKVFVLRDPRQNIRSILNRLNLPGNLDELSQNDWDNVVQNFPAWHSILEGSSAGHKGRNYIETLALRSQKIFQIYCRHQTEVVPIFYEAFNQDKVAAIQHLAAQLDLSVVRSIDRLKDVQFQPKGNRSVTIEAFFGAKNLKLIEDICGQEMVAAGYVV